METFLFPKEERKIYRQGNTCTIHGAFQCFKPLGHAALLEECAKLHWLPKEYVSKSFYNVLFHIFVITGVKKLLNVS